MVEAVSGGRFGQDCQAIGGVQLVVLVLLDINTTVNDSHLVEQSEAHVVVGFLLHYHVNSPIKR